MTFFNDVSKILKTQKIFILGSYEKNNLRVLNELKEELINMGLTETYIAVDKDFYHPNDKLDRNLIVLDKINYLFYDSDFCIFIFFNIGNDSVIGELGEYIKHFHTNERKNRILICKPREYSYTIILGLIKRYEINVFEYDYDVDLAPYCYNYVKRNIFCLD